MTFKAKIVGGQVVLEAPLPLADGTDVTIEAEEVEKSGKSDQTLGDFLMQFAGIMDDPNLPKDGALNHDHYLYGTPKK